MTDKEFVISAYPNAECDDSRLLFDRNGVFMYAIYLAGSKPRSSISAMWAESEEQAWKEAADIIRYDLLRKFES